MHGQLINIAGQRIVTTDNMQNKNIESIVIDRNDHEPPIWINGSSLISVATYAYTYDSTTQTNTNGNSDGLITQPQADDDVLTYWHYNDKEPETGDEIQFTVPGVESNLNAAGTLGGDTFAEVDLTNEGGVEGTCIGPIEGEVVPIEGTMVAALEGTVATDMTSEVFGTMITELDGATFETQGANISRPAFTTSGTLRHEPLFWHTTQKQNPIHTTFTGIEQGNTTTYKPSKPIINWWLLVDHSRDSIDTWFTIGGRTGKRQNRLVLYGSHLGNSKDRRWTTTEFPMFCRSRLRLLYNITLASPANITVFIQWNFKAVANYHPTQ
jgi:hypothetical protein